MIPVMTLKTSQEMKAWTTAKKKGMLLRSRQRELKASQKTNATVFRLTKFASMKRSATPDAHTHTHTHTQTQKRSCISDVHPGVYV